MGRPFRTGDWRVIGVRGAGFTGMHSHGDHGNEKTSPLSPPAADLRRGVHEGGEID